MSHGAFTNRGTNNNLLRFYESDDLIHWKYLYEGSRRPKAVSARWPLGPHVHDLEGCSESYERLPWVCDRHPIDHGGFGMMESADGVHCHPIEAAKIQADFEVPTLEVGGIREIGDRYYFLGGNANHYGFSGYGVYT
jgi:hypothetical protein